MPSIPSETPRKVGASAAYFVSLLVIPGLLAMIIAAISYDSIPRLLDDEALSQHGLDGIAAINGIDVTKNKKSRNIYHLNYCFSFHSQNYCDSGIISDKDYRALRFEKTVTILYDKTDPRRSAINIDDDVKSGALYRRERDSYSFLVKFFSVPLAIILVMTNVFYFRQRHLLRWGSAAPAKITQKDEYSGKSGNFSDLTYEFHVPGRGIFQGTRRKGPARDRNSYWQSAARRELLDDPTVIYDPEDPERNTLYPLTLVKLRG